MTVMDAARAGRTVAEQVYEQIKADLLTGAFTAGAALLTRELLARYGCGISPLREALARLVGEGFLVASGHRGVRVPLPSCADLDDVYRIRIALECEALDLAMKHGDDHWEAAVVAACHRLERAPLPGTGPEDERATRAMEWETRHRAFHAALVAAAPAPRLLRLVEQMVEQTERYRALRLLRSPSELLIRDIAQEHRALLEVTLKRDPQAIALLREHLTRTWNFVADLFKSSNT
ncbi:FCD domain-containing protein [Microbacteriaceae bacterium K1510]|nr:FCD domain-containing protein [Microbacteriaceae bacterium K1510]